jgi:hypothetical protein
MLADVFLRGEARFPLVQREMHALGGDVLTLREGEQLAQQVLGVRCLRTAHSEGIAAAVYAHIEPSFQQAQVLIERPAQIGETRVIRWAEFEFAPWLGC